MCRDLSEIATYARVDDPTFRLLKAHTPGAYTFLLKATPEVPRRLQHLKRKTIGIRVPDHRIAQALLEELNEPMMTTTLTLPQETEPLTDPEDIVARLEKVVDVIVDGGYGGSELTSVIDMSCEPLQVLREGKGDISRFT
jgi:tRNA threonylcarbamoyl adenosine modification protein (Sua5/YciO/YrdC/YwlC family)